MEAYELNTFIKNIACYLLYSSSWSQCIIDVVPPTFHIPWTSRSVASSCNISYFLHVKKCAKPTSVVTASYDVALY